MASNIRQRHLVFKAVVATFLCIFICMLILEFYEEMHLSHIIDDSTTNSDETNSISTLTPYIFQIGFHKAGTSSLAAYFSKNGISSLSWRAMPPEYPKKDKHDLCYYMYHDYINNRSLLSKYIDNHLYFGDFGVFTHENIDDDVIFFNKTSAIKWYKILLKQYPFSVYILNIRNVIHWLKSRYIHLHLYFPLKYINSLKQIANIDDKTIDGDFKLLEKWRFLWYQHICSTMDYFKEMNMMQRLLVFDIERDNSDKLVAFFNQYGFELDATLWQKTHLGRTKIRHKKEGLVKWNELNKKYSEFFEKNDHKNPTELQYIQSFCLP